MRTLDIDTAEVFEPLLEESRYKAAYGGRGSGKSHFFAELLVEDCMLHRGLRAVCIREVQKDLKDSAKLLIEDKIRKFGLGEADGFRAFKDEIQTPGDGLIIFKGMKDYTADSIKSLEGFDRAWVEEGQTLSDLSLMMLRPTIRAPGSQLWFSWNPRRKTDAVDRFFRGTEPPTGSKVVRANWNDNPWFPAELNQERKDDRRLRPDQYGHVWGGEYVSIIEGAYYAADLRLAKEEGRITQVYRDPLMRLRAFWDLGGRGMKSDATTIWIAQFVGHEIRVLDYYEAVGQAIGAHIEWLRSKKYDKALCVLPHDGEPKTPIADASWQTSLEAAGFEVEVVPNQGAGAYRQRIEAARRWFPRIVFNEKTTQAGREALGWYHEKRSTDDRDVGLGAEHDWSSHAADSFGMMCQVYEPPSNTIMPEIETRWVI